MFLTTAGYACEKSSDIKGDHSFIQWQSKVLHLLCEIYGVLDVVWHIPHQRGQASGEVFGYDAGHQVDAAYNGSDWRSFLVDVWETEDA